MLMSNINVNVYWLLWVNDVLDKSWLKTRWRVLFINTIFPLFFLCSKISEKHHTHNDFRKAFQVKFNALFDLPILSAAPIDFPSPS